MAKAPRPGTVKTRLCPPLLATEAAALYRCFLLDKIAAVRALFDAVPWSTSDVLSVTLRRAAAAGLRAGCLPSWFDVDTPDDLERLRAVLDADNTTTACQTRRFLASWRR